MDGCSENSCNNCADNNDEKSCPWWINSPEHHNCLWIYVKVKSGPDGSMPELTQSEIAALMNWSNTKTHFMLKEATEALIQALKSNNAQQLISGDHSMIVDVSIDTPDENE